MGLIFHGKKDNVIYLFCLSQRLIFSKLIHQVVTVKDKAVTVKDRCPTLSVLFTLIIVWYGNGTGR